MSKRKRKKCFECGRRYGKRTFRGSAAYCSTVCRDAYSIRSALVVDRPPMSNKDFIEKAAMSLDTFALNGMLTSAQTNRFIQILLSTNTQGKP